MFRAAGLAAVLCLSFALPAAAQEDRVHVNPDSDPEAIAVAQKTMDAMGGWEAWDAVRYLHWTFFGRREHWWDRRTGDIRIDSGERLVLMNIHTREGRVWENGEEITDPAAREEGLSMGHQQWVNDSYWLIMPCKLLDPGVTLKYAGEKAMEDGRAADVLELTFGEGVGYTPQNRYEVFVAKDTGLVEQWSFYAEAGDTEPGFTLPWTGWKELGGFMIATDHGRGDPWPVDAPAELPREVFTSPDPVEP